MSTSAKSAINKDPACPDIQTVHRFGKQYGYMICGTGIPHIVHLSGLPFITSLARPLKSSGEKVSKNCRYLTLSQISILLTAVTNTMSFSSPAYSFRFCGISNLPAPSNSIIVAPFKKYLRNDLTFGSKSFKLLICSKMGSQLFIGYNPKHFSKPRFMTKEPASSPVCFLSEAGRRNRPFASSVTSYSPRKPFIYKDLRQCF